MRDRRDPTAGRPALPAIGAGAALPLPVLVLAAGGLLDHPTAWMALFLAATVGAVGAWYVWWLRRRHTDLSSDLRKTAAERRRAENALREAEVFYHSLVESLPQSILRKDAAGRFTFVNHRFCAELGRAFDEIIGKTDFDFFPAELAEKYRGDDQWVMQTGTILDVVEKHVTPTGEVLYVQTMKSPLRGPDGQVIGLQGIFWDVTERQRAEERLHAQNVALQELARSEHQAHQALKAAQSRLVQSEKLVSLGQMVAGVAHEINNPLAFVGNNVAVLERDLRELAMVVALYRQSDDLIEERRPELLGRIREACDDLDLVYTLDNLPRILERSREGLRRIQQIVKDLRVFARIDEGELNDVDLNEGVESSVTIIRGHAKKHGVALELELSPLPVVRCYAAKINQVILNLLSNAIDACGAGGQGTVTIRTRPEPGGGVAIAVADTGCGIPADIRERIFDPFFTTKPVGQGTGLGLSISYGIIQDHGGTITVESNPGRGSTFTLHLPPVPAVSTTARPPGPGSEPEPEPEPEPAARADAAPPS
jgi:PAS domain S-box-containing protein